MGHLGVQVEAEDQEEDPCHHEGTAADKLKEVDPSAGRAHHDSLYADESNEGQHLRRDKQRVFSRTNGVGLQKIIAIM